MISERKAQEYLVQVRVATNPHLKPEDQQRFVNELVAMQRSIRGVETGKLDKAGLARLRDRLNKESRSKVKVK